MICQDFTQFRPVLRFDHIYPVTVCWWRPFTGFNCAAVFLVCVNDLCLCSRYKQKLKTGKQEAVDQNMNTVTLPGETSSPKSIDKRWGFLCVPEAFKINCRGKKNTYLFVFLFLCQTFIPLREKDRSIKQNHCGNPFQESIPLQLFLLHLNFGHGEDHAVIQWPMRYAWYFNNTAHDNQARCYE